MFWQSLSPSLFVFCSDFFCLVAWFSFLWLFYFSKYKRKLDKRDHFFPLSIYISRRIFIHLLWGFANICISWYTHLIHEDSYLCQIYSSCCQWIQPSKCFWKYFYWLYIVITHLFSLSPIFYKIPQTMANTFSMYNAQTF